MHDSDLHENDLHDPAHTCALCDATRAQDPGTSANVREVILRNVRRWGVHLQGVFDPEGTKVDFVYTVGLWHAHRHPELIVFGMRHESAYGILNYVHGLIDAGQTFEDGLRSPDVLDGFDAEFRAVDPGWFTEYVGQARDFYGDWDFPLVQLIWPDGRGQFPWDPEAPDWLTEKQPALWTPPTLDGGPQSARH
ncbi:DUF4262 domain-containing protein [Nocardia sp. XZ_19_385]|uniref:DUF4262 domain-containing protein n=1 Tax=Nocardia sp. XZ_19_385 TaxID=2769488 RepID=UPI0018909C79|nr:DUF4262 domain-containing protein [Nocardia sp. XZ_19_385]